jgi:hypothetical protein
MLEAETGESVITVFSINLERSKFGASLFSEGDVYIMPTDSTGIHRDMIEKLLIQKMTLKYCPRQDQIYHNLKVVYHPKFQFSCSLPHRFSAATLQRFKIDTVL